MKTSRVMIAASFHLPLLNDFSDFLFEGYKPRPFIIGKLHVISQKLVAKKILFGYKSFW